MWKEVLNASKSRHIIITSRFFSSSLLCGKHLVGWLLKSHWMWVVPILERFSSLSLTLPGHRELRTWIPQISPGIIFTEAFRSDLERTTPTNKSQIQEVDKHRPDPFCGNKRWINDLLSWQLSLAISYVLCYIRIFKTNFMEARSWHLTCMCPLPDWPFDILLSFFLTKIIAQLT